MIPFEDGTFRKPQKSLNVMSFFTILGQEMINPDPIIEAPVQKRKKQSKQKPLS